MRRLAAVAAAVPLLVVLLIGALAAPAEAHVLPTTAVVLDVRPDRIDAALRIPLDDLQTASGIDLGEQPAAGLPARAAALRDYLRAHIQPTSADGAWTVTVDDLAIEDTEQLGTGPFTVLTALAHLTAPSAADERSFQLHYDVVIHQVITHTVLVSARQDWSGGQLGTTRSIGTIQLDPVTGEVPALDIDLGTGSAWRGFTAMVSLGIAHIREGTDHQLFLLTLLLPAPLLVARRRWATAAPPRQAVRRIAAITGSFTVGHSVTLALGAMGLPVPQHAVEALIAVSILVAAAHAVRPIFPGREALIAAGFGLVHGMAFSATLAELDLSGGQLALSLLGFNVGIELMQLAVVALVLPPLCVLARTSAYHPLRVVAAGLTAIAAAGWLAARVGVANPVAAVADGLVGVSPWVIVALWTTGALALVHGRSRRPSTKGCRALDDRKAGRDLRSTGLPAAPAQQASRDDPEATRASADAATLSSAHMG
jgi:hypothetical protein